MPERSDDLLGAELGADIPEIDIHGMDRRSALDALETFLQQAFVRGDRVVRIVHGRGAGVLREEVAKWLDAHALVRTSRPSMTGSGAGAVTLVQLETNRKMNNRDTN